MGHETNREFEFNDELGDFQVFIDEGEPNPLWQEKEETEPCVECGESTAFGSGRFVDRLGWDDGWKCADCRLSPCDICGEEFIELDVVNDELVCGGCQ